MATIYPGTPLYQNNGSPAELKVFKTLKEKLPDDWIVIHSLRWIKSNLENGRKAQGEGDFIIIYPSQGIMVLEVKGGDISCDNKVWKTRDHFGNIHIIQDPEKQASDTMHEIIKTLRYRSIKAFVCHGVWFPDGDSKTVNLPLNLSRETVLDVHDLINCLFRWDRSLIPEISDHRFRWETDHLFRWLPITYRSEATLDLN